MPVELHRFSIYIYMYTNICIFMYIQPCSIVCIFIVIFQMQRPAADFVRSTIQLIQPDTNSIWTWVVSSLMSSSQVSEISIFHLIAPNPSSRFSGSSFFILSSTHSRPCVKFQPQLYSSNPSVGHLLSIVCSNCTGITATIASHVIFRNDEYPRLQLFCWMLADPSPRLPLTMRRTNLLDFN